jgi:magnesium transporter
MSQATNPEKALIPPSRSEGQAEAPDEGQAEPPVEVPRKRLVGHLWLPDGTETTLESVEEIAEGAARSDGRLWVDVEDASADVLKSLAHCLGLHPLVIEDIVERNQRAKLEYTGGHLHLVMFALEYREELAAVEIDIVLGTRFLLTSHPASWQPLQVTNVARHGAGHFLAKGPDFALYAVVDALVDGYFPVVDRLADEIDDLEDQILAAQTRTPLERMFRIRRALIDVRRAVSPEREIFNQLTNRENAAIAPEHEIYFRDVYDHLIRITDELDTHRELLSGALDAYLSTVNNTLSDVMKRLTAVTAILAGIGAVAGIFGMSEAAAALDLREGLGFWLITAFVLLIGALVFAFFRRIGWI